MSRCSARWWSAWCSSRCRLVSLDRYYRRAFERSDTNERILRLVAEIEAARRPGEVLLVDDGIGAELPDTGVTELRGLEYLLTFARVPYETIRPSPGRLQDSLDGQPTRPGDPERP